MCQTPKNIKKVIRFSFRLELVRQQPILTGSGQNLDFDPSAIYMEDKRRQRHLEIWLERDTESFFTDFGAVHKLRYAFLANS